MGEPGNLSSIENCFRSSGLPKACWQEAEPAAFLIPGTWQRHRIWPSLAPGACLLLPADVVSPGPGTHMAAGVVGAWPEVGLPSSKFIVFHTHRSFNRLFQIPEIR